MATSNGNPISIVPKFNGDKYDYWSCLMKLCLESQDLWDVVENGVEQQANEAQLTEAQRNTLKKQNQKDKKALFQIFQAIEIPVYERISKAKKLKGSMGNTWNHLCRSRSSEESSFASFKGRI